MVINKKLTATIWKLKEKSNEKSFMTILNEISEVENDFFVSVGTLYLQNGKWKEKAVASLKLHWDEFKWLWTTVFFPFIINYPLKIGVLQKMSFEMNNFIYVVTFICFYGQIIHFDCFLFKLLQPYCTIIFLGNT